MKNFRIMELDYEIHNGDAARYSNIDAYSLFYIYNSFGGQTFKGTVEQIEMSIQRNPREVVLIYINPFYHKYVIEDGIFKLDMQMEVDQYESFANIYVGG